MASSSSSHSRALSASVSKATANIIPAAAKRDITISGRRDMLIVRNTTRGNNNMALTIAGDPELLSEAITEYKGDVYSSGDTSVFDVKTWGEVHTAVNWRLMGHGGQ